MIKWQYIFTLVLIQWTSGPICGQPYFIQGNIEHTGSGMIYLASYYGDRFSVTDSLESGSGSFQFILPGETPAGIFRLVYPEELNGIRTENRFVEFIFNGEDLTLNVSPGEAGPIPYFENSTENQVYFDFMIFQMEYESSLKEAYAELLSATNRYEFLQMERKRYMDSITAIYPDLYAVKIMNSFRAPVIPGSMSHRQRIDTLKRVFFEDASISDPSMLYAPVYTFRIVDYLSLYREDLMERADQEIEFIQAVDQIMANVSSDSKLRSFVVEFLLEGFELLSMETVQAHLADYYLDASCASDVAELVKARMEGYKKMAVGSTAPDFVVRDLLGKNHRLSAMPNKYVVVMFWSSTCGHCRKMIPLLHKWYLDDNNLDVEVVAISIDTVLTEFETYTSDVQMDWITVHDPLGWHGKVPGEYHIYATPSLFLLDENRKIIERPAGIRQFQRAMKKLQSRVTAPDPG